VAKRALAQPLIEVRDSALHGKGVFALRRIEEGTLRTIEPGEELTYDYQIQREADDPPDVDAIFACRCGFGGCRGTMLWPQP
jgi:SET domain-containing protein